MRIIDNRNQSSVAESPIVFIERLDDSHAKIILYSGYSIFVDHDEFIRLGCVLQPKPCVTVPKEVKP